MYAIMVIFFGNGMLEPINFLNNGVNGPRTSQNRSG
jgi:hypothetical protein